MCYCNGTVKTFVCASVASQPPPPPPPPAAPPLPLMNMRVSTHILYLCVLILAEQIQSLHVCKYTRLLDLADLSAT